MAAEIVEEMEQAFIDGKKVGVYYSLVKFSGPQDSWGEDIALIRVSREVIKIECDSEEGSVCSNIFAFTGWSANSVGSR